jgi:serine/threonine protein kinase
MGEPTERPDVTQCLTADEALAACGPEGDSTRAAYRAHIERCGRCRVLVAEAARAIVDVGAGRTGSLLTLGEGEQVAGRYRIVKFLARGGMGEVYEAFDQVLQEPVALKTLLATALDDDRAVARLAVEVRLARRVTHPNVCRILEFGFHAPASWKGAQLPFLTMELLSGEPLSRRLARGGPLPPGPALELARQMVAGLSAIHGAGIVHRDWKSDNAFLARSEAGVERLVVMDFGLAHVPGAGRRSHDTTSGIAGTADYVSPEQLQGGPLTPAADIYALGVVLFELVTGKRPFSGGSTFDTALRRLREDPPRPSSLAPGLPAGWDRAVLGCLERRPDRRFPRVEDVLQALQSDQRPPHPRWLKTPGKWLKPPRRWLAPLAFVLPLVAVAGWLLWPRSPAPPTAPTTPAAAGGPGSGASDDLPPRVPAMVRPAVVGTRWPMREIPVCLQATRVTSDPEAAHFAVHAKIDFTWNILADFWLHDAGPCPPDPRGMIALTLTDGHEYRADLGYRADAPVRVHLGVDLAGLGERVVQAFGRALGLGLRGEGELTPDEIALTQSLYGVKPPGSLSGPWGRCLARADGKPSAILARCRGGPAETWRRDSHTRQLRTPAEPSLCLGAQEGASKQPLRVGPCAPGARDRISLRGASWRVLGDRCATALVARPDGEITAEGCDFRDLQRWDFFEGDDRIRLHGTDLCVTAPADAVERGVGTRLSLQRCRTGAAASTQVFHLFEGGLIKVDRGADLCLAMMLGAPRSGRLGLGTWCDRQPAAPEQLFSLVGPLRAGRGCVTVPGHPDDHAPVWVLPCVGGWDKQTWQYWW